ncbi:MAG: beta-galactosidase, partial [Bacteroidetes bacterium]|nr:beta-galactosidase [Fibrella sp.]
MGTTDVPPEQQRYMMYAFYNIGYQSDPNFSWASVETAINNGCNGIQLCVPWDEIYPTRTGPANWATLDKQIERIVQLGAKVALRIGVHRDIDRVDTYWTDENGAHTYKNELLYKNHSRQFSPAHQPTVDLASDFVKQVAQRYSRQQQEGSILFVSVTNTPFLEQEYSATNTIRFEAGEINTVTDYSNAMITGYRAWLTTKYTSIAGLNAAWGRSYASFSDVQPQGLNAGSIYDAFSGKAGKDWYVYRHKVHKSFVAQTTQAIKSANSSYKVVNEHGSVFDNYSVFRGTLSFKDNAQNADGVKVNDSPYFPHRFSMDLVRSNISTGKWVMNEVDGIGYARLGLDPFIEQVTQSFQHGAKVVVFANFADAGGLEFVRQITQRVRSQGWMDQPVPDFAPVGNIPVKLSRLIDLGYGELGIRSQWTELYNQNGNKPVRITLDEDILDQTPIAPPPTSSPLSLLAPTLDCATGLLTFRTAGGDNTAIEYMVAGLSPWSTSPTVTIEASKRIGVAFVLKARQSGQETSYNYTTACGNNPPTLVTPIASQNIVVGQPYSFVIPANTFTDADGQIVSWVVSNLPPGLTFNADTRTISGTPSSIGTSSLTLVVTDNGGATAQTTFTISTVGATTPPPTTPPPTTPPPTNPGPTNSLSMVAPGVDCATGLLTFKTAGGDGTPIEYMAVGLKAWSTSSTATIAPHQREGVTFTLKARQSGREVSYTYTTNCSSQPPTPTPPPSPPVPAPSVALSLVTPGFDCATGKLTLRSRGGDG